MGEEYDLKVLEEILYEGKICVQHNDVPQAKKYKVRFTPDPPEMPCEDSEKLEKLLLGKHLTSKKIQEIYDPLDLVHSKELSEMGTSDKVLKTYLNDKRQYQTSNLPTVHTSSLKDLASQISMPTVLKVTPVFIIIGNTYGLISMYSHSGHEIKVFQSSKVFGEVTSLDISSDDNYLISGYNGGQLGLWDIKAGTSVRVNNSYHTCQISAFKFWSSALQAISADVNGKVMMIEYTKNFLSTSINAAELFKGEIGTVSDIQILVHETQQHAIDNNCVVAIAGSKAVVVYTFSPEICPFYTLPRPESVPETSLPCIAWKYALVNSEKNYTLSVGWGSGIGIYRLKFTIAEGVEIIQFLELSSFVNNLIWMSDEVLLASTQAKEVILKPNTKKVIGEWERNFDLINRSTSKDSQARLYKGVDGFDRKVFLLGSKDFFAINLLTWSECIDELSNKGEWLEVLSFGLDLYSKNYPSQYGSPESVDELRNILEQLITIYVKVGTIAWVHKISNTIEFCVGIDALDILFNMLLDFFVDHGAIENMDIFVNNLEPYILNGKITKIPTFVIGKIMAFYLKNNTPEIIEKIILNLDAESIDPAQVIPIIKEYKLLTAAITVHSRLDDFLTPLVLIYECFTSEKDIIKKKLLFYKILWFMRLCFQKEKFIGGEISEDNHLVVVKTLTDWLSDQDIIGSLVKQDIVCFLHVIFEISSPQCLHLLLKILPKIYMAVGESPSNFLQFSLFVGSTVKKSSVHLPYNIGIKVAKFLLDLKHDIVSVPIGGSDILSYIHNFTYGEQDRLAFMDITVTEISRIVLKLLKTYEKIEKEDVDSLLSITEATSHILVHVYLLDLVKEHKKALESFLKAQVPEERLLIFEWLNNKFKELSAESPSILKSFENEVKDVLGILVDINSDKLTHLVSDWFQGKHGYIITKLNNAPHLQLKYLSELLKDQFDKDLELLYVKLLCKHTQDKVLKFLKTRDVEFFDECLKICADHKVYDAEAYLNERLGAIKEALDLLISGVQENRLELIAKMRKKEVITPSSISYLGKKITKYCKVCIRNKEALDNYELEEFWFSIFRNTLDCYNEFKDFFYLYPQLEPMLHNSISFILTNMLQHVDLSQIITCVSKEYDEFPFKHMRNNIVEVLSRHTHQKKILQQAIKLLKADTANNISLLLTSRLEGMASDFFLCRTCGKKIHGSSTGIYIFACGHVYHKRCQEVPVCLLCTESEFSK